ncbi:MAG: hypothetical protein ACRET1_09035, partial [Burkholderiales bacterium]
MPVAGLPRCCLASCRCLEIPTENKDKAASIDCKIIKKAIFILLMNKKHASGIGPFLIRAVLNKNGNRSFLLEEREGQASLSSSDEKEKERSGKGSRFFLTPPTTPSASRPPRLNKAGR